MTRWQKEKDCYREAHWPRTEDGSELAYRNFMSSITNPLTNKFNSERNRNGNEIQQLDGKNARYVIYSIVRIKRNNGEVLTTKGQIQGFSSLGVPISKNISELEVWEKMHWHIDRKYDTKTNTVQEITTGIDGKELIYELPYSPENVEKLYSQSIGVNGNKLRGMINNNQDLSLVVKDEKSGLPIQVEWSSADETRKLFKDKDFEYLFG